MLRKVYWVGLRELPAHSAPAARRLPAPTRLALPELRCRTRADCPGVPVLRADTGAYIERNDQWLTSMW